MMRKIYNWMETYAIPMILVGTIAFVVIAMFKVVSNMESTDAQAVVIEKVQGENSAQIKYNTALKMQRLNTRKGDSVLILDIDGEEYPLKVTASTYKETLVGDELAVIKEDTLDKEGKISSTRISLR